MTTEAFQTGSTVPGEGETLVPGSEETTSVNDLNGNQENSEETEVEKPKVFTQEDLDKAIAKQKAKIRRQIEREYAEKINTRQQEVVTDLSPENFNSTEEYLDALAEAKAQEKIRQKQEQEKQQTIRKSYESRVEKAIEKYSDYEQVAHSNDVRITNEMASFIMDSDVGPEIAYFLGKNPEESYRIADLPPLQQAREIGKLEAKLIANPPAAPTKKVSSAPDPIKPIATSSSKAGKYETTDPRSVDTMSVSEWIEAERKRQLQKYKS